MFESLFEALAANATRWRTVSDWPLDSLRLCGRYGVYSGLSGIALPEDDHGTWTAVEQMETLIRLAKADLLTTFVITQHVGAIKRIAASDRLRDSGDVANPLQTTVLRALLSGTQIASVGISHLTTSRLHLDRPAVTATRTESGYQLFGTVPWVTGAPKVQQIVVGASLDDETQILVLISPTDDGVSAGQGAEMVAMSASCTDAIRLEGVLIPDDRVLSGPRANVLVGANRPGDAPTGAGGLQTSALALGLSSAALDYLRSESIKRKNLTPIVDRFDAEHNQLHETIRSAAIGDVEFDSAAIRSSANGLVQRTTSAAMTTAKGAGMMIDHPVGRWCQQALFFLVWSCPQPVADAHLCELVGLE